MRQVVELPVDRVDPDPGNDRTSFDKVALAELAENIRLNGLAQPITVRTSGDRWTIVAGERRWRAACLAELPTVDAIVRDDLDDQAASAVMLAENVSRKALDPMEEAHAFDSRMKRFDLTAADVAAMAGVTPRYVERRVALLRLQPEAEHLVRSGQMGPVFGFYLAELDANRQAIAVAAFAADSKMPQQDFAALCDHLLGQQRQESMFDTDDLLKIDTIVAEALRPGNRRLRRPELVALVAKLAAALDTDDPLAVEANLVVDYETEGRYNTHSKPYATADGTDEGKAA